MNVQRHHIRSKERVNENFAVSDRRGHEAEEKDREGEKCTEAAAGVERRCIVDGSGAEETKSQ
jgi:hypothetical protein